MIQYKNKCELMHINESEIYEKLVKILKKYKAKRTLYESKLKTHNDPRRNEFYTIIARLSILDIIIMDLEALSDLLTTPKAYEGVLSNLPVHTFGA